MCVDKTETSQTTSDLKKFMPHAFRKGKKNYSRRFLPSDPLPQIQEEGEREGGGERERETCDARNVDGLV